MPFSTPMLDEHSSDGPEPFGARLKALREARGLSIEQVAEATNIQTETIEAIEAGTITETTPTAYARGFVRTYAEHLEADVDQIMDGFDRLCHPERARLYLRGLGPMAHKDYRPSRRRGRRHPIALAILVTFLTLLGLGAAAYVYVHFDEWLRLSEETPARETLGGSDETPQRQPAREPREPPERATETAAASEARYELVVIADENAWIRVEQDGVLVVSGEVIAKGKSYPAAGAHSVRLTLRDPSRVRVYKDGRPITEDLGPGPVTLIYDEEGFRISTDEGE